MSPVTYPAYASTTVAARADGIELAGAATEGRSAIVESIDALRRLRLLTAAPSTCERCRYATAVCLVGTREGRRMRFLRGLRHLQRASPPQSPGTNAPTR